MRVIDRPICHLSADILTLPYNFPIGFPRTFNEWTHHSDSFLFLLFVAIYSSVRFDYRKWINFAIWLLHVIHVYIGRQVWPIDILIHHYRRHHHHHHHPHIPFTRYDRLSNRLFNRFHNRLYRINGYHHHHHRHHICLSYSTTVVNRTQVLIF